jgi:hypothetical protein
MSIEPSNRPSHGWTNQVLAGVEFSQSQHTCF